MKTRWFAVLAGIPLAFAIPASISRADAGRSTTAARLEVFLRSYVERQGGLPPDRTTRYAAAFVDLNGDGRKEAVVYLSGRDWCGSGGCPTLILTPHRNAFRLVTQVTITRQPIRLLKTASHGWRDIGVLVQGGGIQPGYEAALSFDGRSYPRNPSVPPARPVTQGDGAVLIGPADEGKPLYR